MTTAMTNEPARCVDPSEITADDIMAYAPGAAPPEIIRHIARCAACHAEAEGYARLSSLLQTTLFRHTCPATITLGEYALGMLVDPERRLVAEHLVECPHCLGESRNFTSFLAEEDALRAPGVLSVHRGIFA